MIITKRHFQLEMNLVLITKMIVLTALAFSMGFYLQSALDWSWSSEFLLMLGVLAIGCWVTGLLNLFKMLEIVKDRNNKL